MQLLPIRNKIILLVGITVWLTACGCGGGEGEGEGGNTGESSWDVATLIESDNGKAGGPQIAIDTTGNALAVWSQDGGAHSNIWANLYTAGVGWGIAELI